MLRIGETTEMQDRAMEDTKFRHVKMPGKNNNKPQSMIRTITAEDLKCLMHLPLKNAAQELGMSDSNLKKICRHHGVFSWPSRRIASKLKTMETFKCALTNDISANVRRQNFEEIIKKLEDDVVDIINNPNSGVPVRSPNKRRRLNNYVAEDFQTPPKSLHQEPNNISPISVDDDVEELKENYSFDLGCTLVLEQMSSPSTHKKEEHIPISPFSPKSKLSVPLVTYVEVSVVLAPLVECSKLPNDTGNMLVEPSLYADNHPDIVPNPFNLCKTIEYSE
mmetsp:Transcript_26186/g.26428  ORF Transcript_26186/g.26428 Transcript_26186/m.26428 type:complete len:278 (+) Transcript_26186:86-919(+)